jgi:hypothetical protein
MKLLGLDNAPSSTGWAILVHDGRTDCGSFKNPGATQDEVFANYDIWLGGVIAQHARTPEPIVGAAIEESLPSFLTRKTKAKDLAGGDKLVGVNTHETNLLQFGLRAIAKSRLKRAGIPVLMVAPRTWRSKLFPEGTKAPELNSKGRPMSYAQAKRWWKHQTVEKIRELGIHVPMQLTETGRISNVLADDDAADACGIVLWARKQFLMEKHARLMPGRQVEFA